MSRLSGGTEHRGANRCIVCKKRGKARRCGDYCNTCFSRRRQLWQPSRLLPGSPAKVQLMRERDNYCLPIHHPQDFKIGSMNWGGLAEHAKLMQEAEAELEAAGCRTRARPLITLVEDGCGE